MKKGFTLLEMIIAMAITITSFVVILGAFFSYLDNIDEVTSAIASKIKYTQNIALTSEDTPYIEIKETEMSFISEEDKYKTQKYNKILSQIKAEPIKIKFDNQGHPIDDDGNVKSFNVFITKDNQVRTIKVSCNGNIEIKNNKDTEEETCSYGNINEDLKKTIVCADGEEIYNGSCIKACQYFEKRINGECKPICEEGKTLRADGTCVTKCNTSFVLNPSTQTCECAEGYEVFGNVCLAKCTGGMIRQSDGRCDCPDGYENNGGICELLVREFLYDIPGTYSFVAPYSHQCTVEIAGAGGGGGGGCLGVGGTGGNGEKKTQKILLQRGNSYAVIVGKGGTQGLWRTTGNGNGGTGGSSSFDTITARGGGGGVQSVADNGANGTSYGNGGAGGKGGRVRGRFEGYTSGSVGSSGWVKISC